MRTSTQLVAVKRITSDRPRSDFPEEMLEQAARAILAAGIMINPIILKRLDDLRSYKVVDGDFEYYAAVRAREIDPLQGENIEAIILEADSQDAITQQIDTLRGGDEPKPLPSTVEESLIKMSGTLERIEQLISGYSREILELFKKEDDTDERFTKVEDRIDRIERHLFLEKEAIESLVRRFNEDDISVLETFLADYAKISGNKLSAAIQSVIKYRERGQKFTCPKDIEKQVKHLGAAKVQSLVDAQKDILASSTS